MRTGAWGIKTAHTGGVLYSGAEVLVVIGVLRS
jgi:hypothetical protein